MKVTLYYDFIDERYFEFPDAFEDITCKGYEYTCDADPSKTLEEIYEENRELALRELAFKYAAGLGDFICGKN